MSLLSFCLFRVIYHRFYTIILRFFVFFTLHICIFNSMIVSMFKTDQSEFKGYFIKTGKKLLFQQNRVID